jgi:hypothetical protein
LFELKGGGVVFPDLAGAGALIALAPPGLAFAGEEEAFAVRGDGGLGSVVVEEEGFGFGSGDVEEGEASGAGTAFPEGVATDADEEVLAVGHPIAEVVAFGVVGELAGGAA